jgi:mannose-6-phosphate isomerase-like protein (cupin superfamily)
MTTITKNDIMSAIQEKKIHLSRNFMPKNLSWSDISDIYDLDKNVIYISWASFQAQEKEIIFGYYKHVLDSIGEVYKGYPLFGMVIVHLVSRNNNTLSDPDFLSLSDKFFKNNPEKIPEYITIRDHGLDGDSWESTVHFDRENRVYVQGGGQTMWKFFDDSKNLTDAIILNPGDLVFIPKGLFHSVESLGARHSLSLAYSDEPVI